MRGALAASDVDLASWGVLPLLRYAVKRQFCVPGSAMTAERRRVFGLSACAAASQSIRPRKSRYPAQLDPSGDGAARAARERVRAPPSATSFARHEAVERFTPAVALFLMRLCRAYATGYHWQPRRRMKTERTPMLARKSARSLDRVVEDMAQLLRTPEWWAELANRKYPSSPRLTAWFPHNIVPTRLGWYERYFIVSKERQYWDGKQWLVRGGKPYRIDPRASFWPSWRGLAQPAATLG
jgi:hypothetical protein